MWLQIIGMFSKFQKGIFSGVLFMVVGMFFRFNERDTCSFLFSCVPTEMRATTGARRKGHIISRSSLISWLTARLPSAVRRGCHLLVDVWSALTTDLFA